MALWGLLGSILGGAAKGNAGQAVQNKAEGMFDQQQPQQQQQQPAPMDPLQQSALEAQLQRDQQQRWATMQAGAPQNANMFEGQYKPYQPQPGSYQPQPGGYFTKPGW